MEAPSAKEIEALKQFRPRIADLNLQGTKKCDLYSLSWLRARDLDITKAEAMLRKCLEWEKGYGIDQILKWKSPEIIDKELPYQMAGFDKGGCPIVVFPFGKWDLRKMVELGYRNDYIRRSQLIYHQLINLGQVSEESYTQFVFIMDMEGYPFRQLTSAGGVDTTLEIAKIFEANYPERLKTAYIVNAPKIFSLLFALVKPLLSARTLAKVQIYSSNSAKWKAALLNNIPGDQLPTKYGGTKATDLLIQNLGGSGDGDADSDGLVEVTVGAGEKLEAQYDVKHANTTLSWRFKTENFDISFAVFNDNKEVVAIERVDSHVNEQFGNYLCTKPGKYILLFDNTYSVVRPKTLHYVVTISCPDDSDDDENTNL